MGVLKTTACKHCEGEMRIKRYTNASTQFFAILLLLVGGGMIFTPMIILGGVLVLAGLYLGCKMERRWVCTKCRAKVEMA